MYTPQLTNLSKFITALQDYKMSSETKRVLTQTPFVLMVAATSSGRNTIINELLKTGNYYFIVSDTTRPPRSNDGVMEQSGVEYFFRTEKEMLDDIKSGRFVEAAVIHNQQVSGISVREIEKAHQQGKIAITDIEIVGTKNIARVKSDVVPIFILPPNFEEWLRRMRNRGEFAPIELHNRLMSAVKEFRAALDDGRFTFVINDKLKDAVKAVDEIVRLGVHDRKSEIKARELAKQLYEDTRVYLEKHGIHIA